jgi:hypothetical protein
MKTIDRFLFSNGVRWELARLLAVFTPVSACLFVVWWIARNAAD